MIINLLILFCFYDFYSNSLVAKYFSRDPVTNNQIPLGRNHYTLCFVYYALKFDNYCGNVCLFVFFFFALLLLWGKRKYLSINGQKRFRVPLQSICFPTMSLCLLFLWAVQNHNELLPPLSLFLEYAPLDRLLGRGLRRSLKPGLRMFGRNSMWGSILLTELPESRNIKYSQCTWLQAALFYN